MNKTSSRLLIIQACELPQLVYLILKLAPSHQVVVYSPSQEEVSGYLGRFPELSTRVLVTGTLPEGGRFDQIVFPLLNRGYWQLKFQGLSIAGQHVGSDYSGELTPLDWKQLLRSCFSAPHRATREFSDFLKANPLVVAAGQDVLVVESCHSSLVEKTQETLDLLVPPQANVTRIHEEGQLPQKKFDSAIIYCSGESGFFRLKILPILLGIEQTIIIRENGESFPLQFRTIVRLCFERLFQLSSSPQPVPRILLVQTDLPDYLSAAAKRLRKGFPKSTIHLVCSAQHRPDIEEAIDFGSVTTYPTRALGSTWKMLQKVGRIDADLIAGVFARRRVFWKQKLFFLLHPIRDHLVFNASLDSYYLTLSNLLRLSRSEPILFSDPIKPQKKTPLLLIQTDEEKRMAKAIRILRKDFPDMPPIQVLCREDKAKFFRESAGISEILTYARTGWTSRFNLLRVLWKKRDLRVAAILSRKPTFRASKLLFVTFPNLDKLFFNENLDYDELRLDTLPRAAGLYRLGRPVSNRSGVVTAFALKVFRITLFVPRFAYLLGWVTFRRKIKLKSELLIRRLNSENDSLG